MPNPPTLFFGKEGPQKLLCDAYVLGVAHAEKNAAPALLSAGILRHTKVRQRMGFLLDSRHPAFKELCALLKEITGRKMGRLPAVPFGKRHRISPNVPIGIRGYKMFRVLVSILEHGPLTRKDVGLSNSDLWSSGVTDAIRSLLSTGLIAEKRRLLSLAPTVPKAYLAFLRATWKHLKGTHKYFPALLERRMAPATTYGSAADGAPRIFGIDAQLRNLMALAKYGPMNMLDLRRLTGTSTFESRKSAPFGRRAVVIEWREEKKRAAMLDPNYPVAVALRRFLLKMEEHYPLPPFNRVYAKPKPPKHRRWRGDRLALFGSPIPTTILQSIAPMGWTFEALCVELATGFHRENIKISMKRLEDEDGVLVGDRKRKPGFNVRVVTVSEKMPAYKEFMALLKACNKAWPEIGSGVRDAMNRLAPRTKEHLRRRGLIPR